MADTLTLLFTDIEGSTRILDGAATLWAAAEKTLADLNRAENPSGAALRDRWLPAARAAAPDAANWDSAYARGAEISLDEALAAAVSEHHSTRSALAERRS